ncbi:hypothetical protein SAMN05421748_109209 [Paractinoplanes atraurantiacus]|uniref:Uncharacterized protein n=1 Tax=Paractinoplanes atraurantiacus TaxID=1036182 RepID=A0A285IM33_9ACTN|nr:hypothetical protein SAMN05421748_109209 [Actinoplanes atraurantiacus]
MAQCFHYLHTAYEGGSAMLAGAAHGWFLSHRR